MENFSFYNNLGLIYPGSFVPLLKEAEVESELKQAHAGETVLPPVNVTESADAYKIEVAVPGVRREDFMILADDHKLSISVVHKATRLHEGERFQMHEFNYAYFNRHVILPDNADTEFISAEYEAGILRLYVPKARLGGEHMATQIVVY